MLENGEAREFLGWCPQSMPHAQHSKHSVPDDWILSSASTVEVIENTLNSKTKWINKNKKVNILVVGCGTSSLSVDLQRKYDEFIDVTSIDISGVAILAMKKKYPALKFLKADCCKLPDFFKKHSNLMLY